MSFSATWPALQSQPRSSARGAVAALAAFVVATALGLAISARWGSSSVVLLYVPPVLTAAAFLGRRAALLVAVLATVGEQLTSGRVVAEIEAAAAVKQAA